MEWHRHAKLFPMLEADQLNELADDIRENGLRHPIVIDDQDRVLDGRNRQAACVIAGVEPVYEPFVGTESEKLQFVISTNLHRRHLTESQRSMIAAEVATMRKGDNQHAKQGEPIDSPSNDGVSLGDAARSLAVGRQSAVRARKVKEHGTEELQQAVTDGLVSVSAAADIADKPDDEQRKFVADAVKANQTGAKRESERFTEESASKRLLNWLRRELNRWPERSRPEAARRIRHVIETEFNL